MPIQPGVNAASWGGRPVLGQASIDIVFLSPPLLHSHSTRIGKPEETGTL